LIQLEQVSYSIEGKNVLQNLDLEIEENSFHSIVGLNGAGKTVLLKIISGIYEFQSGKIQNSPESKGYVFQDAAFFPWLTILQNLEICSVKSSAEIIQELGKFHLSSTASLYPNQLSGGTLQKISILRAFLNRPELILMDEPFSHLDLIQKEEVYEFTLSLWRQYKPTIILVSHDLDECIYLSATVSHLSRKTRSISSSFKVNYTKAPEFAQSIVSDEHRDLYFKIYLQLKGDRDV